MDVTNRIKFFNANDLIGVCLIVFASTVLQFVLNELPCPLCLLQRVGLIMMGYGYLLNIRYQIRPGHYAFTILSAIFTGLASGRQMALHFAPNDPGYGAPFLGLHLYTWVFILCVAVIIHSSIRLSFLKQYSIETLETASIHDATLRWIRKFGHMAYLFMVVVLVANIVAGIAECGFQACPDDPIHYKVETLFHSHN